MIHTGKGFGIANKAEVDAFLKLYRFFNDPTDVGNLISGSSAFLNPAALGIVKILMCVTHGVSRPVGDLWLGSEPEP